MSNVPVILDYFDVSSIIEIVDNDAVQRFADCFAAMGSEPRLRILRLLLTCYPGGMIVGEIQQESGIANSTLTHHLDKLKHENLVVARREGTAWRYIANAATLKDLLNFFLAECCTRNRVIEPPSVDSPPCC